MVKLGGFGELNNHNSILYVTKGGIDVMCILSPGLSNEQITRTWHTIASFLEKMGSVPRSACHICIPV